LVARKEPGFDGPSNELVRTVSFIFSFMCEWRMVTPPGGENAVRFRKLLGRAARFGNLVEFESLPHTPIIGKSSKGRIVVFETTDLGSTPSFPAKF
jgi:hypothetical protein